ncbi:MAG: carboxylesterase family protein [Oscillospiraceae bacterium]|nr:carboxylesterase family protein [Oscillospiraceae bacterium]
MLRVTKTENGMVKGFPGTDARITVFKGIPFAAPTCGDNRWRAPQPPKSWEGVRECYEFGPITMQAVPGKNPDAFYSKEWHVDPEVPMNEDGLRLNIWTPAKSVEDKLPVMVWFFGGGFREGYAWEMEFDGERIAHRGVILVSVAYRVNVFGFLCHPELTAEDPEHPTNFGMLDQLAGLKWVERNIENFGGDPKNITIFGQSAGGGSVWNHLASPQSRGHYQKAIVESAGGATLKHPADNRRRQVGFAEAEQMGVRFLKECLGVDTIAEARKLDAQFVEDKCLESGMMFWPQIDGKFLTVSGPDAVANGTLNNVPLMTGNTTDEFPSGPRSDDEAEIEQWVRDSFGEYADEYLDICRRQAAKTGESLKKAVTIGSFEWGARVALDMLAEQGRDLHYYVFGPTIPGDDAGAFHSSDLWFEFETLMKCWRPFDGHHFDVARKMCNYWTNFAKNGDPNGNDADGTPMPTWEKFTTDNKFGIFFGDEVYMNKAEPTEKEKFLLRINR